MSAKPIARICGRKGTLFFQKTDTTAASNFPTGGRPAKKSASNRLKIAQNRKIRDIKFLKWPISERKVVYL